MRSLYLAKILELHEEARPVWRIVEATGTPEAEVRRMLRVYQQALDSLTGQSLHITERARTITAEYYVGLMSREMGPDWIAQRVGITRELAFHCLARINRASKERRPARGEQGAKTRDATLTGQTWTV